MNKILGKYAIPINHLYLLQQEEYKILRYLKAVINKKLILINTQKVKKLVWTSKVRWIFTASVLSFLTLIVWILVNYGILPTIVAIFLSFIFPVPFIILGTLSIRPLEYYNKKELIKLTSTKLNRLKRENGLKIIGITGSYGKTTTKFMVHSLLMQFIPSYATPKSYNTLFGIAKPFTFKNYLLKEVMKDFPEETKIFIVEMGTYHKGEIEELCKAYPPDIAIITGIAPVHLERMKTIENIIKAKGELLEALPNGAPAFINIDNEYTPKMAEDFKDKLTIITYGRSDNANVSIKITNFNNDNLVATINANFTDINGKDINKKFDITAKLTNIGMATNLVGAIAVALYFGISSSYITRALSNLHLPESRMQRMDFGNGIVLINNGYNSNPISFKNSIDTLSLQKTKFKIFATPGMFELGDKSYQIHRDIAHYFKDKNIDYIYLVGPDSDNIKGLLDGLKDINYPQDKIKRVSKTEDIPMFVAKEGLLPATILIENDIVDQYN